MARARGGLSKKIKSWGWEFFVSVRLQSWEQGYCSQSLPADGTHMGRMDFQGTTAWLYLTFALGIRSCFSHCVYSCCRDGELTWR